MMDIGLKYSMRTGGGLDSTLPADTQGIQFMKIGTKETNPSDSTKHMMPTKKSKQSLCNGYPLNN